MPYGFDYDGPEFCCELCHLSGRIGSHCKDPFEDIMFHLEEAISDTATHKYLEDVCRDCIFFSTSTNFLRKGVKF